ncbi:hypothetical protein RCEC007_260025 [Escherichia coli]|nr:hypothetical protein RCEC007_260025 [Escherichia coli]
MTHQTHTIAESNNFIVLDKYIKAEPTGDSYQSESDLERELIQDLQNQGYEFISVKSQSAMLSNVREQLQSLNGVMFNDSEWRRFTEQYLDNPSDGILDKTRKIHIDYICDFIFDDGRLENIYLIDKKNLMRNKVQIIQQFEQTGSHANRYDVTILVNGLPLVQIELKNAGWRFVRLSTRYIVTVKRVLTAKIPCLSICNCLSFLTAPIPVILPTRQSAIKTVLTSP